MADNKKYYYLKLKDNFFDSDAMVVLESMPDGYLYSNILLKLYLRSLRNDGKLMFNDRIPYNSTILSSVTRHSVGVVEKALQIFKELELIEIMDNGAIYMLDIQNFIGESSTEADRKRNYRKKIESEKGLKQITGHKSGQMSDKNPPEIEIEIEKEIEKEIDIDNTISKDIVSSTKVQPVIEKWNSLNLQKIISINSGTNRHKLLNARIKEYGEEAVLKAMDEIKDSAFLKGQNKKNWIITFDWFIKPNNFLKVLEGNYKNKEEGNRSSEGKNEKPKLRFNNFEGRDYDYDDLEKKLLGWD